MFGDTFRKKLGCNTLSKFSCLPVLSTASTIASTTNIPMYYYASLCSPIASTTASTIVTEHTFLILVARQLSSWSSACACLCFISEHAHAWRALS